MNSKQLERHNTFRFKRFSHKTYSAFNSMHKIVNIGVVATCVLTFAHTTETSAQSNSLHYHETEIISEKELDEVTVTASRIQALASQTAKPVVIITRSEIEQSPAQSISDLLNYVAGIDVQQRGGHGVQTDISIRGGSFDQTAILLNGVNLSNPQTGHYSFDIPINLSDIDHIEILYGSSSLTYGASAFSGGINIITRKKTDHKGYIKAELGSHKSLNSEIKGVINNDIITSQLSAGYKTSDGYIDNSDFRIFNLLSQTRLDFENSKIDIQIGYNKKDFGANTFYSPAYPNQYDKTSANLTSIIGEFGAKLKFKPILYWNRHNDCFQLIRGDASSVPYNYHKTDVYGSNLNLEYASQFGITSFGAEFRNEGIMSSVLGKKMNKSEDSFSYSDNRTNVSYMFEHNLVLNKMRLSGGVLINKNRFLENKYRLYPSINASFKASKYIQIYSSWAKATRMPTFTDLYYTTPTHIGNSDLNSEDSETLDLGFKYRTSFIEVYITGYLMKGRNIIDWIKKNPDDKWESRNITDINKKGLDIGITIYPKMIFSILDTSAKLKLGYSRLHQNTSTAEYISNYALNYLRDKFTAQADLPIYKNLSVCCKFRWQKRMGKYLKYDNLKPTDKHPFSSYSTLDIQLNWTLKHFQINATANNVFDRKYFDVGNIPQAGIWLMTGLAYTFK